MKCHLRACLAAAALMAPAAHADLAQIRADAVHGNAASQLLLAELYQYGFGVKDHDVTALSWYLAAAKGGNAQAAARAKLLEQHLSPEAVATARRESATLVPPPPVSTPAAKTQPSSTAAPTPVSHP